MRGCGWSKNGEHSLKRELHAYVPFEFEKYFKERMDEEAILAGGDEGVEEANLRGRRVLVVWGEQEEVEVDLALNLNKVDVFFGSIVQITKRYQ